MSRHQDIRSRKLAYLSGLQEGARQERARLRGLVEALDLPLFGTEDDAEAGWWAAIRCVEALLSGPVAEPAEERT